MQFTLYKVVNLLFFYTIFGICSRKEAKSFCIYLLI